MYGIRGKKVQNKSVTENERLRFQKNQIQKFKMGTKQKAFDPRNPLTLDGYREGEFAAEKQGPGRKRGGNRGKPDFFDVQKPSRRGDGEFKARHERNLNEKLNSLDWRKSKKSAGYQMPLKQEHKRAQKRRITPMHTSNLNRTSGKRHFNRHIGQPKSASPMNKHRSMRPEAINYANNQYKKQKNFEIQMQKEAGYRRHTPERKNNKELNRVLRYSYVQFPEEKLTSKPNKRNGTFDPNTYMNTSPITKQNYYGRRFTDITRSNIILG